MNERVFADEFQKGFLQEEDFLAFLAKREENSQWKIVKSKELRFYPIADGQRIASKLEEELKEKGKEAVFRDTMHHTRLILKVNDALYPVRNCAIKTILERVRIFGNTFADASYDHSIVTALWSLDNEKRLLKEYRESLLAHGLSNTEMQLGLLLDNL